MFKTVSVHLDSNIRGQLDRPGPNGDFGARMALNFIHQLISVPLRTFENSISEVKAKKIAGKLGCKFFETAYGAGKQVVRAFWTCHRIGAFVSEVHQQNGANAIIKTEINFFSKGEKRAFFQVRIDFDPISGETLFAECW